MTLLGASTVTRHSVGKLSDTEKDGIFWRKHISCKIFGPKPQFVHHSSWEIAPKKQSGLQLFYEGCLEEYCLCSCQRSICWRWVSQLWAYLRCGFNWGSQSHPHHSERGQLLWHNSRWHPCHWTAIFNDLGKLFMGPWFAAEWPYHADEPRGHKNYSCWSLSALCLLVEQKEVELLEEGERHLGAEAEEPHGGSGGKKQVGEIYPDLRLKKGPKDVYDICPGQWLVTHGSSFSQRSCKRRWDQTQKEAKLLTHLLSWPCWQRYVQFVQLFSTVCFQISSQIGGKRLKEEAKLLSHLSSWPAQICEEHGPPLPNPCTWGEGGPWTQLGAEPFLSFLHVHVLGEGGPWTKWRAGQLLGLQVPPPSPSSVCSHETV